MLRPSMRHSEQPQGSVRAMLRDHVAAPLRHLFQDVQCLHYSFVSPRRYYGVTRVVQGTQTNRLICLGYDVPMFDSSFVNEKSAHLCVLHTAWSSSHGVCGGQVMLICPRNDLIDTLRLICQFASAACVSDHNSTRGLVRTLRSFDTAICASAGIPMASPPRSSRACTRTCWIRFSRRRSARPCRKAGQSRVRLCRPSARRRRGRCTHATTRHIVTASSRRGRP